MSLPHRFSVHYSMNLVFPPYHNLHFSFVCLTSAYQERKKCRGKWRILQNFQVMSFLIVQRLPLQTSIPLANVPKLPVFFFFFWLAAIFKLLLLQSIPLLPWAMIHKAKFGCCCLFYLSFSIIVWSLWRESFRFTFPVFYCHLENT